MISFKEESQHKILEILYNKRHKQINYAMENAFGILKKSLKEFFTKFDLYVFFVFDAFNVCCLLHNILRS
jgi:hypothetical protein